MQWNCTQCGTLKDASDYYRGHRQCKDCIRAKARRWYRDNTERAAANALRWRSENPARMLELTARWNAANPERILLMKRAGYRVKWAIKRGTLTRGTACEACDATGVKIEAAHSDYSRPLDVRWLCIPCHRRADHANPKTL